MKMKTKKPKTTKLMWFFFATLAIILLFVIFSTGFHNADLGYNFKGNGAYDCNLMNCVPLERVYMGGMMMMQSSFIISIVLNLVLVYFLLEK